MYSLHSSIQYFIDQPSNYILTIQNQQIQAQQKGVLTWLWARIDWYLLGRQNYDLKSIRQAVCQLEKKDDPNYQKFINQLNSKIFNYLRSHPQAVISEIEEIGPLAATNKKVEEIEEASSTEELKETIFFNPSLEPSILAIPNDTPDSQLVNLRELNDLSNSPKSISEEFSTPISPAIENHDEQDVLNSISEDNSSTASAKKAAEWLENYSFTYFAHAVWETNVDKVLQSGQLQPAEYILRQSGGVEYEKGSTYGSRGAARLILLDDQDYKNLLNSYLHESSNVKKENFEEIDLKQAKEVSRTFKSLVKDLKEGFYSENIQFSQIKEKISNFITDNPLLLNYYQYKNFKRYKNGWFFSLKSSDLLFNKVNLQNILCFGEWKYQFSRSQRYYAFIESIDKLAQKYNCSRMEILISFDEARAKDNKEKIDDYLFRKYQKNCPHEILYQAREEVLPTIKLNAQIRMHQNGIRWRYGEVVILKGIQSQDHRKTVIQNEEAQNLIGEYQTPDPYMNQGKFFIFDLRKDPDILILGPKDKLQHYEAQGYTNLIYKEDLTADQKNKFQISNNQ